MKKTIMMMSLLAVASASAGDIAPVVAPVAPVLPTVETKVWTVTLQGGVMHTEADNASLSSAFNFFAANGAKDTKSQMVPSLLYGATLSVERNLTEPGESKWFHSAGASVGYYTGSENNVFSSYSDMDMGMGMSMTSTISSDTDVDVNVIPILLTYNLQYEATESLYFYAGVRGGVVIRKTEATGHVAWESSYLNMPARETFDESSTKVVPTLGLGIGMRAYMTESLAFDLSYDFNMSFGDDCDDIKGSHGSVLPATSDNNRYFGTIKAGFSYAF